MPAVLHEMPLFLTSADRPLYAVLHLPERPRAGAPVVVHCHSLGAEQIMPYRTEVCMARAAAAAGFPVMRFHARGHGDSAGDYADVTLDTLTEDALAAAAEARARTGASGVVWLALRFGALVAAEAIRREGGAAGLALWEPVHRSTDWARSMLRELVFSQVAHGQRPAGGLDGLTARLEGEGRVDVLGYFIHHLVVRSAAGEDLATRLAGCRAPVLLVQIQGRRQLTAPHAALVQSLEARGVAVRAEMVHHEMGWSFNSNPPWLGDHPIARTVEWLDALA